MSRVPAPLLGQTAPSSVFRHAGGFGFQAESSSAKVSLHYSVIGEMRLLSRGTAMLRGPHGSCQGVPRAASPSCPQQTGTDLSAGPAWAVPRRPDVPIGSCSWFLQPRVSQYLFLPFTVFLGCCCTWESLSWLKHGPGAGAGWRTDPDLVLFPFVPLKEPADAAAGRCPGSPACPEPMAPLRSRG